MMSKIHEDFDKAIEQCRFKKDWSGEYDYRMSDGTWDYKLNYEGYGYVLYKQIKIHVKPLFKLFWIYNKFVKGKAQVSLYYAVPLAHFRDAQKLIDFVTLLTDKLDYDEE